MAIAQRDLVERAQRGDRDAFDVLAAASIDQLYNLAQLMLADPDLASDAVQEALIAAWRDLRSLRDPDSFRAWLDRVLVRCVYRAAGRERRQVALRQLLPAVEDSAPDPARTLETRDAIHRAFREPERRAPSSARGPPLPRAVGRRGGADARHPDRHLQVAPPSRHGRDARELDADARRGEQLATGAMR